MAEESGGWVGFDSPDPKLPEWAQLAWVDDNRLVFVPGLLADNPDAVAMKAMFDGVETVIDDDGHVYYPLPWMKAEYPVLADFWERTEGRILRVHAAR